jgi:hypothetical protein
VPKRRNEREELAFGEELGRMWAKRHEVGVEEAARRNCLKEKVESKEKMHEMGKKCPRKKQKPQDTP